MYRYRITRFEGVIVVKTVTHHKRIEQGKQ